MANNEHINKVVKSTGETLIDLTSDTVTPSTLLQDTTAHDRSGAQITGTVIVAPTDVTETEDNTAYLYKTSEHDAVYDELVGGSVAWNQLIPTTGTSGDNNGVVFTNNGDGSWTLNGTTTSSLVIRNLNYVANKKNFVDSHKYLMYADCDDSNVGMAIVRDVGSAHYAYGKTAKIINYVEGSETASWARIQLSVSGYKVTNVITKPQVFDLTQMFGSTIADYVYNLEQSTAGSGIEWLKSYGFFTEDYYAYNAGGLVSVNTSGKKVVGKNLLKLTIPAQTSYGVTYISDSETGIVTATGTSTDSRGAQFSIPIPTELVGNYYFSALTSTGSDPTYDAYVWCSTDSARAKKWDGTTNSSSDYGNGNCEIRLEAGKTYTLNLRVKVTVNNLVFKPMIRRADVTDPTFEPYTSITYPIQSTDLRGLYKLNGNKLYTDGDIYPADGNGTRKYGIVDLGTLDWTYNNVQFMTNVNGIKSSGAAMLICSKYPMTTADTWANMTDKTCGSIAISDQFRIKDSSYTDAATFKTAMSGVYLIYELATPTTATFTPFTSPQMVYRNGTEEYIDTRDMPVPVGGNRKYVDIPEWMVNEYFDDVRAEASNVSEIIEKIRRIDVSNGSSSTVRTIYAPDANNGIQTTVRNNRTEVQVACGQASNANGRVVFTDSRIYGGIGNPTSLNANHFMFNDNCGGDSIGKLSSGSPLTGSEFNLNYETINLKGSTINIDDNMSMVFETEDDFTVNTINSPYMMINTDGISLLPKTLSYFSLLISRLPSGAGSELVVNSNGTVYQSSSSRDIKHDIQYIEDTESYHDALMRIKPATYVYNNDTSETTKLGMIAEDIADVMPIAALTGESGKVENYDTRAIIAMLVMEVQRLNAEIERLRGDSNAD